MLGKLIWFIGACLWFVIALVVNVLLYALVFLLLVLLTVSGHGGKRRAIWNTLRGQKDAPVEYTHPLQHNNLMVPRKSTYVRFKVEPRAPVVIPEFPEGANPHYKVRAS